MRTIGQTTYSKDKIKTSTIFEDDLISPMDYRDTTRKVFEVTEDQDRAIAELAFRGVFPVSTKILENYPDLERIYGIPGEYDFDSFSAYIRQLIRVDYQARYKDEFPEDPQMGRNPKNS